MTDFATLYRNRFGFEAPDLDGIPADLSALAPLLARGSQRRFRDEPVSEGLLAALLACAQSAPTKSNLQQYSIVVLSDPETRKRFLERIVPQVRWAATAPLLLVFLGDVRRGRRIAAHRGYEHRNDNVDTFMNAAVDAALAMQCFIAAAEAVGLGCCPLSVVRNHLDALADLLALPPGVFPIAGLAAGWPEGAAEVSLRLPPEIVVHRDRYDDGGLEAAVESYDDRVFAARPIPPEKQRHVDRYGVAERGVWSENVARQLSLPERPEFRDWLRRQELNLK
ncbi:MAG: nitroreductase family protein [Rhodospirillales bacterium]|nr:MAG: nitroreductase family protein [Rhodospirillales bacterium]